MPAEGRSVTANMPAAVYNCTTSSGRNYNAVWHDTETWNEGTRRLNKLLRHNPVFPVNRQGVALSFIQLSEPTRLLRISYAVFCVNS